MIDLQTWLKSGKYLPEFMRDFHDQKDVFKSIHKLYGDLDVPDPPSWVDGHMYTIDRFLWYMASRGYTLQKSRKHIEFKELLDHYEFVREDLPSALDSIINRGDTNGNDLGNNERGVSKL